MENHFSETLKNAQDLKESFKCLQCKTIPLEPFFTGVCDHLLCKECITKSNECPICSAGFYQKDLHVNKMIKEAILYVNQIIQMTTPGYKFESESDCSSSLPDIDLNLVQISLKNNKKPLQEIQEVEIFALPQPIDDIPTQTRSRSRKSSTKQTQSSQKPTRSQSTRARKSAQIETEIAEESQRPRTQSANRRVRKNDKGETALHLAVMNNDIEKIKDLLNDPLTDINAKDYAGWTPLHEAVNKDNIEIMKILIEHNANINAGGYQNNTPLHEASLNKRYDSIKLLLESGADQTIRNDFGVLAIDFLKDSPEFLSLFKTSKKIILKKFESSNEDDFMSSTFMQRRVKNKVKKLILYGSGMKDDEKAKMAKLATKFGLQIAKEMNNNVTHVIFTSDKTCARTINYMKAILMGIWISPKLFEDCSIYFYGDFNVFDKQDLIKLAEQAGAKILKREPKLDRVDELITQEIPHHLDLDYDKNFSCSHFLIYDATKFREDIKHKYLYSVKTNWLFACIDQFKILHPESLA
ncbi:unnamed protein product, partial [Brachionus calyciflorus]